MVDANEVNKLMFSHRKLSKHENDIMQDPFLYTYNIGAL